MGIADILNYLTLPITVEQGFIFLDQGNIEPAELNFHDIPDVKKIQYYNNGMLLSGLTVDLSDQDFSQIEDLLLDIAGKIENVLNQRLRGLDLSIPHEVVRVEDEEYGDLTISVVALV